MAVDNKQIAESVIAAVGGKDNIASAVHCMTRLRLTLKDRSALKDDEVKGVKGVIGTNWSGSEHQVVIGQNVPKVYEEALKMGVLGGGSVDEDLGDAPKERLTPKSAGQAIMNYLSKTMVTLIPLMMAAAMFRTIASVLGPTMLNVWSADSDIYNLFFNWLYNAGFYFMPIVLGWSAAKQLGCSQVLGMMMGGVLMAPELMALVDAGAATTTVFGIPAPVANYSMTVLPIVLCMPVLALVEKFFKRILPDVLVTVFEPFLTMLVMVPVALCALAPLGSFLGNGLGNFMFTLGSTGGIVTVIAIVLIAGFWEFLVMTGMHQVLITLALAGLATNGFDGCVFVGGTIASCACWGLALGAFLRLKEREEKSTMFGFVISAVVGGITEPALYGCGFKYPRTFIGLIVGGMAGGLVAALSGMKIYVLGNASIISAIAGPAGGGMSVLVGAVISEAIAVVVTTVVVYFFGFTKEELEADRAAAEAEKLAA